MPTLSDLPPGADSVEGLQHAPRSFEECDRAAAPADNADRPPGNPALASVPLDLSPHPGPNNPDYALGDAPASLSGEHPLAAWLATQTCPPAPAPVLGLACTVDAVGDQCAVTVTQDPAPGAKFIADLPANHARLSLWGDRLLIVCDYPDRLKALFLTRNDGCAEGAVAEFRDCLVRETENLPPATPERAG